MTATSGDNDDNDNSTYPGAPELCDGKDNDQNGRIDDGIGGFYYLDRDGDGFGDLYTSVQSCATPIGYVLNSQDCNDNDANEYPGQTWYRDQDGDGYPAATVDNTSCTRPDGWLTATELVGTETDNDDNDYTIYPGAFEICDGKDNDQDGLTDEECGIVFVSAKGDCANRSACYKTISEGCSEAWNEGEVRVKTDYYIDEPTVDKQLQFTLTGGWNQDFSLRSGSSPSTISGKLTICRGTVIIDGIVIEGRTVLSRNQLQNNRLSIHTWHLSCKHYIQ